MQSTVAKTRVKKFAEQSLNRLKSYRLPIDLISDQWVRHAHLHLSRYKRCGGCAITAICLLRNKSLIRGNRWANHETLETERSTLRNFIGQTTFDIIMELFDYNADQFGGPTSHMTHIHRAHDVVKYRQPTRRFKAILKVLAEDGCLQSTKSASC